MGKKTMLVSYIILSLFILLYWLILLFYAFFLGGATGPPNFERSVPLSYVGIMSLGGLGAVFGIAASINGARKNPSKVPLPQCAVALCVIGSIPFFLMDTVELVVVSLLVSLPTPLLYLALTQEKHKEEES